MKKIVLITSGQPSINPRLVKEADALVEVGYEVIVIYCFWTKWAFEKDKLLLQSKKWKAFMVGGNPFDAKFTYFLTRALFKFFQILSQKIGFRFHLAELSKTRAFLPLYLKALDIKADLYIGHNLAALPVAVAAAKKYKSLCGFDAEDFHRQEVSDDVFSFNYLISKYLEDKYFPEINYITAASPLIAEEYKKIYPSKNPIVINNVFPSIYQLKQPEIEENQQFGIPKELKLFWFSQTVGKKRGIEDTIIAMGKTNNKYISLTVLGNVNNEMKQFFIDLAAKSNLIAKQLVFFPPVDAEKIFEIASHYDLGLALETDYCKNRSIALTNKLFSYLISGIAIIASETEAQKKFMETYPDIGKSYPIGNTDKYAEILNYFYNNPSELTANKINSYNLGKCNLNWEIESQIFVNLIKKVLEGAENKSS
jgi:glycosyltransferase involved in cell wall biosynthesis